MNITVLGCGLIGSAIARDLASDGVFNVTSVDMNGQALQKLASLASVQTVQANVLEPGRIAALAASCDLMVCAVPGFMGFETLKRVIEAGKNVVDISFFPEDAFLLNDLAMARGVMAVVDCGVAPGLCNILAGHAGSLLDDTDSYTCYVGGLPRMRLWPYEYRAVFSPRDVIEEYTRPVFQVVQGRSVVLQALSDLELLDIPGVGTLEAFNTDGLRSLHKTLKIPTMREKTLRYPGHANLMRVFRESGFFNAALLEVDGQHVSPLAVTSKLLFEQWRMSEDDEDMTIMQVIVEGRKDDRRLRYVFDLNDRYDQATRTTSMARTTGYTCALVARQAASGLFAAKGICPPEWIGQNAACYANLMAGYQARAITVSETVTVEAG